MSSMGTWVSAAQLAPPKHPWRHLWSSIYGLSAEAVVRGHKSGLFTSADYNNLCQCESLEDIKLHLVSSSLPCLQRLCCISTADPDNLQSYQPDTVFVAEWL